MDNIPLNIIILVCDLATGARVHVRLVYCHFSGGGFGWEGLLGRVWLGANVLLLGLDVLVLWLW